jgi:hypothetical protein
MLIHVFVAVVCNYDVVCVPIKDQVANKFGILARENVPVLPVFMVFTGYLFENFTA